MNSLTSFLPLLVPHLGITQAAVYERQRALVRLGLLPKPDGRGRGSGAAATPRAAALICLSVLATDNLSEMDDRIVALARAPILTWRKRKRCGLTGATNFVEALSVIFSDYNLACRTISIDVERRTLEGHIHWKQPKTKTQDMSEFSDLVSKLGKRSSLMVNARLDSVALRQVSTALAAEGVAG